MQQPVAQTSRVGSEGNGLSTDRLRNHSAEGGTNLGDCSWADSMADNVEPSMGHSARSLPNTLAVLGVDVFLKPSCHRDWVEPNCSSNAQGRNFPRSSKTIEKCAAYVQDFRQFANR